MHLKRQEAPKNWSIFRKGTKYVVRPRGFDVERGVPLLFVLRDMLNVVQNRKEAKRAVHLRNILHNNSPVSDETNSVVLFDTLSIVPEKKHYRMELSLGGKFVLKEISEKESNSKVVKIINKKTIKGKKVQLNLMDGRNFLSSIKCKNSDSVIVNFKDKKVEKCIPLEDKSTVFIFSGKHAGKSGKIKSIGKDGFAELSIEGKDVSVLIKQIMAIQ